MRKSDGTVTPAEEAVLAILRTGPAATSGHTEDGPRYRFVDHATCRRLAKAGLVSIDLGGWASIVPESLAE